MCGYPCSSLISDCVRLRTFVWICRGFNVGAGLPAIAISLYTTLQAVAANANHDAKRAALDLLLILISGAPLNHAGRTQA
ncbi:hypothetical protein CRN80_27700 [Pseudomonas sp. FDAARGOS_380]|nr:hypothetical protein CRN80_27700 [Pseudomonas sp. FDAARGOS_380]